MAAYFPVRVRQRASGVAPGRQRKRVPCLLAWRLASVWSQDRRVSRITASNSDIRAIRPLDDSAYDSGSGGKVSRQVPVAEVLSAS